MLIIMSLLISLLVHIDFVYVLVGGRVGCGGMRVGESVSSMLPLLLLVPWVLWCTSWMFMLL